MEEVKNIETAEDRTLYEVGFHILPTIGEEDMTAKYNDIKELVEKHSGSITKEGVPVMTDLAYTMIKVLDNKHERFDSAYFGWLTFEMEAKNVVTLKEELDHNTNILRFLIVLTAEDIEAQAVPILKEEKIEKKKIDAPHEEEKKEPVLQKELDDKIEEMEI